MRDFQVRDVNNRMDGPDIRLELNLPADRRLIPFTDPQRKLDVGLYARNSSDALAEHATFRVIVPQTLAPAATTYSWPIENRQPEILLHNNGQQKRQDGATIFRKLYQLVHPRGFKLWGLSC